MPHGTSAARLRLALLRLAGRFGPIRVSSGTGDAPRSVLLIRPDHLGDVLFTGPAIRSLRAAWPQAHITLLVGPWSRPVAEGLPDVDRVLTLDFPWFSRRPRRWLLEPYALLLAEARRLAPHRFDLALVLRFDHWWGAWLAQRAGIPRRVGYALPEMAPFLTQAVRYEPGRHEVLQNVRLAESATGRRAPEAGYPLAFVPTPADEAAAQELLAAEGIALDDRVLCVHPGTGAPVKLWRNEAWAAVIDGLCAAHGLRPLITGGPGETALCADLAGRCRAPVGNLAGRTDLGRLAAVMARCRLVLGVDSGPLHLAVASGAPTVHLFGPVDPRSFGPWGPPNRHLVVTCEKPVFCDENGLHTPPCNRLDFPADELAAHRCVHEITVEQVLAAARSLLA